MSNDPIASDVIDEMLREVAPGADDDEKLEITNILFELLRLCAANPKATLRAVELLSKLPWSMISFPVFSTAADHHLSVTTHTGDGRLGAQLLNVAREFCNVMQLAPEAATRETLKMLVELPAEEPVVPEEKPGKFAPPIASTTALLKVFTPAKVTPSTGIALMTWQSQLPTGLGPLYSAIGLRAPETLDPAPVRILLETGEIVTTAENFLMSPAEEPDYAFIPPQLLANYYAYWAGPDPAAVKDLGKFAHLVVKPVFADVVVPLTDVFKNRWPNVSRGVTLRFDGTPYRATLTAHVNAAGPYAVATLIDKEDNVLVRLDTPRMFAVEGVYIFPLGDTAYVLVIE
jgi:hypothetical protein